MPVAILFISAAFSFCAVGGAFLLAPRQGAEALAALSPDVTYFVPGVSDAVALTIDDGPDPAGTPEILDVLHEHSARATFFLIGSRVARHEDLVGRIVDEGHEIANHDYRERMTVLVPEGERITDIGATHDLLSAFGPVRWFRPGSGLYDAGLLEIARDHRYGLALGDVFPLDGRVGSSRFHRWYLLRHAQPGSILILHDAEGRGSRTAETLRWVLPALRERGLEVVALSQLDGRRRMASPRGGGTER
ncbi:MAG: polysaccharide deacetylase family protein [Myxococcota bacterium]|nr:polysaccharide deacetylase family protein [Myxococcota bacterium]